MGRAGGGLFWRRIWKSEYTAEHERNLASFRPAPVLRLEFLEMAEGALLLREVLHLKQFVSDARGIQEALSGDACKFERC